MSPVQEYKIYMHIMCINPLHSGGSVYLWFLNLLPNQASTLGLVRDPRTTDPWLGLWFHFDKDEKLKTAMDICNIYTCITWQGRISCPQCEWG
jgi:hypothetical protein